MPNDCTELKTTTIGGTRLLIEKLEFYKSRAYAIEDFECISKIDRLLNLEACSYNFNTLIEYIEEKNKESA